MAESLFFAKVEDGIVTSVVTVESLEWIQSNPERYGDASLYVPTSFDDPAVLGARVGWTHDAVHGFVPPAPHSNWVWKPAKQNWFPPVDEPADAKSPSNPDGVIYDWNQDASAWVPRA